MNRVVICFLKRDILKLVFCALLVPLLFCGCYDSQSESNNSKVQSAGIAALSRFFPFSRSEAAQPADDQAASWNSPSNSLRIRERLDSAEDPLPFDIAMPVSLNASPIASSNPFQAAQRIAPSFIAGTLGQRAASNAREADLLFLNTPFKRLFASIFASARVNNPFPDQQDEPENPFTEAKRKQQEQTSAKSETTTDEDASTSSTQVSNPLSANSLAGVAGAGALVSSDQFLIIGDFDASGVLSATLARRSSQTTFVGTDGELTFNLFVNYAPLEYKSAFYIDDINGDGAPDFLLTRQTSLFGSVFLGDGAGDYFFADKFVTGYEPMVPGAGPLRNGKRELLMVDMRSGTLTTFSEFEKYQDYQRDKLPFVPNYALHLVSVDTPQEFLMAAQTGGRKQILRWGEDDRLEPTEETLPVDPVILSGHFGFNSLQVYQVGNYASVMLAGQGRSFNVANFRVFPNIFLIIGDIQQHGLTDVAIANLVLFTPKSR
jgi:hypothetical protein